MDYETMLEPLVEKLCLAANETEGKHIVDTWFMMDKPWPMLTILAAYLYFVLKLGPKLMDNRKPMELKKLLLVYNGAHVLYSSWWLHKVFSDEYICQYYFKSACYPSSLEMSLVPKANIAYDTVAWLYLMSKFLELSDTIFFVLRKKQNQISFLHLYHHTIMVAGTWAFLKYIRGSQTIFIGVINTAIHVAMYSYYLLAALGPKVQKYLWWKRYLTTMQLVQFLCVLVYLVSLLLMRCDVKKEFIIFCVINTLTFFILFSNFYIKTYTKKSK
uniref:Elongation of very long chain fatty acids protein n=2 Tax=Clastoptera arizonana TaxID=38151 RepID=A0A1B6CFE2_9HEMI